MQDLTPERIAVDVITVAYRVLAKMGIAGTGSDES